jgi:hypothetical protein
VILPGESKTIDMEIAKLHTAKLKFRLLFNGLKLTVPQSFFQLEFMATKSMVEIVRQLIAKNQQAKGTIICIPNQHVWFYQYVTTISDGRDLNRVFLEAKRVFASRFALPYFNRNNALLTMQSIFMQEAQVQRTFGLSPQTVPS